MAKHIRPIRCRIRKQAIAYGVGIVTLLIETAPCRADVPAVEKKPKPKVNLHAGTQADADAAAAVIERFLSLWTQRKHDEAAKLVDEPVRKAFADNLRKREITFQSLNDISLRLQGDILVARVHAFIAPSADRPDLKHQEIGLDMVSRDGKWWVTKR
jgi:hypothetical protein